MQLTGQETLPVGQAEAWDALNDTEMLKASITGCEALTPIGEGQYEVLLSVAVGPLKAKFKGRLALSELQPPDSYRLAFEGSGGAAGHGKGQAQVRLEAVSAQQTTLHYAVEASVGGKIAQLGSRLVDMAAQKMAKDFFAAFKAALQARHPEAAAAPAPAKSVWQKLLDWYLGWLGRIFTGRV